MARVVLAAIGSLVAHNLLAWGPLMAAEFTVEQHDRGATIKIDGQLFTEYLVKACPKPILWPIIGPTGVEMTRAYPMRTDVPDEKQDHIHQRSFWFTHGKVNGVDFWSELANHGSIMHKGFSQAEGGQQATLNASNDWFGPDGKKHLEDERRLTFRAGPNWRSIDFDLTLKATEGPVVFGDTKEGAFGIRVPTIMDVDKKAGGKIVNAEGATDKDAWGKRSTWVDYQGPVGGKVVGIAILNHPSSFRHPTWWHVREYGLFAANPFGVQDFTNKQEPPGDHTLEKGQSMVLRYRVIFHEGDEKQAALAEAYKAYAEETK